ncbi:MAG: hypothetical protein HY560_10460, partial [Gemmatimonadetes bacterium]|nr:hypothetical protein [Gemmatimonadota bacterium]
MLPRLVGAFRSLPAFRSLKQSLPHRRGELAVAGLAGSSPSVLLAALAEELPQRVFAVVTRSPAEAERWLADLSVLAPDAARLYPQREAFGEEEPHLEIAGERVETIAAVLAGRARLLVTTLRATVELTRMPRAIETGRLRFERGGVLRLAGAVEQLGAMGYERRPSVLDVAQFAVRGGIIDVYGFGMAAPARIEWSGDEIVSMRTFDLDTQRSEREVEEITVLPVAADRRMGGSADPGAGGGGDDPPIRPSADRPRQS